MDSIKNSPNFSTFEQLLNDIKKEFLYKSQTHGILHNERVSLFSFYIANTLKLSIRDVELSLFASMYHDIGRTNDLLDNSHGLKSAQKLPNLGLHLTDEELKILQTIITCHSIDDKNFAEIAKKNGVKDFKRANTLFNILKDSDALDRVRLPYPCVRLDMLRTEVSKQLVPLSYKLFNFYYTTTYIKESNLNI